MSYTRKFLGVAAAVGGLLLGSSMLTSPASAATGVCPVVGAASDCNLLITFGPGGSVVTTLVDPTPYDGIEDQLVGILNNSGGTISSFTLTGSNNGNGGPFAFDNDGISSPPYNQPGNAVDTTGYGGPLVFFSLINGTNTSGQINIIGGLANGQSTYFSLEEPASLDVVITPTPEPASLAILGTALAGLGLMRRRRRNA